MGQRLPDRHPNRDFFILDVTDAAPKDDMASMEHPIFSLSTKPDMRQLEYEHNGNRLRIIPSGKGLATILDKDVLLYCISKLVHDANRGAGITPVVEFSAHEVMVATNWHTNSRSYQRFEDALIRLRGTTLVTDIETDNHTQTKGFGLIESFEIDRRNEKGELSPFGRMTKVRITLSDWTFRAVKGMEVLSINADYFRLRRPLERRLYELARKHVGEQQKPFTIGLEKLQKKVGSNSPLKKFRFNLKAIAEDDHIPDYRLKVEKSRVMFIRKGRGQRPDAPDAALPLFESALAVQPDTMDKARSVAPGYDIYALYQDWRGFALQQDELPRNADAAFLGFCKRKNERNPVR